MTSLAAALVAALSVTSAVQAGGRPDLVLKSLEAGRPHTGELLVQFGAHSTAAQRDSVRAGLGAVKVQSVRTRGTTGGWVDSEVEVLRLPPGLSVAQAVRALDGIDGVDVAEPNWIYQHSAIPNDALVGQLWGMTGTFGSQASVKWPTNCSNVVVGIIDEGFMHTHEDLAANSYVNTAEIAGNSVDDDGNGYVDDTRGWDFDGGNNSTFDSANDDHGTHVAGTIGAVGNNSVGVAGVCHSVKMMSAKFLGRRGGTTANAIAAVDYFTGLKAKGHNIVATNNSWGGGGFSGLLRDAIERANAAGILFVAAAGNDATNNDVTPHYPSSYDNSNVIAVASITSTGALSSFSGYGLTSVDIAAPGSSITSTVPKASKGSVVSGYAAYSGTSMATPHVTGAVALYKALHPTASATQIRDAILSSATVYGPLTDKVATDGRLNVSGF